MNDYERQAAIYARGMNDWKTRQAIAGAMEYGQIGTTIHERIEKIMSVQHDEVTFGTPPAVRQRVNGSATSQEMNDSEHASGSQGIRQGQIFTNLEEAGPLGLTSKEMRRRLGGEASGNHHGKVSGALSSMHEVGQIARLTERRDGAYVYVLNEHVNERMVQPFVKNTGALQPDAQKAYDDGFAAGEQAVISKVAADAARPHLAAAASRPHLNPAEVDLVAKIEHALPGMKARHEPFLKLTLATAETLVRALRRIDQA